MSTELTQETTEAIKPIVEQASLGGVTILNARREPVLVYTDDPRITRALLSEAYDRPDRPKRWCGLTRLGWMAAAGLLAMVLVVLGLLFLR